MQPGTRFAALIPLLGLAACSPRTPPEPTAMSSSPAAAPAASSSDAAGGAPGAHHYDPMVINFAGFGPATFGSDEEHVRMAWGRPLASGASAAGSTCHYLAMDSLPGNGRGIRFMMEDGKFVRYDVDVPLHVAPGGIAVGDDVGAVRSAFPGRVEDQPHKYVEGARNLIVSGPEGAQAKLVFETDAAGRIVSWRIGVPPQIYYVEGCG
jgi:hypothetical protein